MTGPVRPCWWRGRPLSSRFLHLALSAAVLIVLGSCGGDTLYDPDPDSDDDGSAPQSPPAVAILEPGAGGEVLNGQTVRIQAVATGEAGGISEFVLTLSGAVGVSVQRSYSPPRDSVVIDTTFVIPDGAAGPLEVRASARDARGAQAQAETVTLTVTNVDRTPPTLALGFQTRPRIEVTDPLVFQVTARDNSGGIGIGAVGVTAIVVHTGTGDTLVLPGLERGYASPRTDQVSETFTIEPRDFPAGFIDRAALPAELELEVHAYALDAAGNCATAVDTDTQKRLRCEDFDFGGTTHRVANHLGARGQTAVVAGRTSVLPDGGKVADLLVDTLRNRLYTSNIDRNKIQILEIANGGWGPEVFVGSRPWGLALSLQNDSVYVANSGGTNLSVVSLDGAPVEDRARRVYTPNDALYEIEERPVSGVVRYSMTVHDFSDRPQFITQDAQGRLLYSTQPTPSATAGTMRRVDVLPGWAMPEARLLVEPRHIIAGQGQNKTALAHVDSVFIVVHPDDPSASDLIEIFDHLPGFPDIVITSGQLPLADAIQAIRNAGSDIIWGHGSWDLDWISLADTTYLAISGDREWVAFGEGGRPQAGRINFWNASDTTLSYSVSVVDIVHNASEPIRGLDLNRDGTLGVARGFGANFFTTDLRLQGSFDDGVAPASTGAVLHPRHPGNYRGSVGIGSTPETIAFVGTGNYTVRIVDTVHFTYRGEIPIRDNLSGPFRTGPPTAADNLGKSCPGDPTCVVAKLYGATDGGGVVVIDVLASDIKALH